MLLVGVAASFYAYQSRSLTRPQPTPLFEPYSSNYRPPVFDTKTNIVHSMYGDFEITEPLLQQALVTPAIERLKGLHQGGILWFFCSNDIPYTRYEHSVGVMVLIRKFGGSVLEQLAGLYHDASHPAFSHLADDLFKEASYQDDHHEEILDLLGVGKFLQPFGLTLSDINHKSGKFTMLEQEIAPNTGHICVDRLEYNLATGLSFGRITEADCTEILHDLSYEKGDWFFKTPSTAKKFATLPMYFSEHFWFAAWNRLIMEWASVAIRKALDLGAITLNEFLTSTDAPLFEKISNLRDAQIQQYLGFCYRVKELYEVCPAENANHHVKTKFRGIDPYIKTQRGFKRLTSLDKEFAEKYNATKSRLAHGCPLKVSEEVIEAGTHLASSTKTPAPQAA